jgi:hypothetical protein
MRCRFNDRHRRMRGAIRFDRPTREKQTQNDAQYKLLLPG